MRILRTVKTLVTGKLDSFNRFALFSALLVFLIFFIAYKDVLSSAVLAVVFHLYLRLTHFIYDIAENVFTGAGPKE